MDLSMAYGDRDVVSHRKLWLRIREIVVIAGNCDWLLVGDFNEIRSSEEREDHGVFDAFRAAEFNNVVHNLTKLEAIRQ